MPNIVIVMCNISLTHKLMGEGFNQIFNQVENVVERLHHIQFVQIVWLPSKVNLLTGPHLLPR